MIRRIFTVLFLSIALSIFYSGTLSPVFSAEPPQTLEMKDITNEDGIDGITVNFFVKGKIEDVWKYISDVPNLNKLFPAVKEIVKVKEIDDSNILWNYTLESSLGTKIFNVKRTNDEKNGIINWKRTDGDMKYYGGSWKIKASDKYPGWVDCTYSNFVDAGWFLPFAVVKRTSRENAQAMVPSLRKLVAGN
jgi:uncharacterized membrane protein